MIEPENDPLADLFAEYLDLKAAGKAAGIEDFLSRCPEERREELRRSISFVEKTGGPAPGWISKKPPERFGDYEILRAIGKGGMGVIYEAEQRSIPRRVALKLIAPWILQDDKALGRLQREAQAIAKLQHPNIVTVHATGEEQGIRYLAMEMIPGRGLDELRAEWTPESVPIPKLLRWIAQIARALHCAHEAGVVHRDVKPSNIRVTPDERVILIDFGLAQDAKLQTFARSGDFRGSPQYASPEQVAAHREGIGPRSDVYSLGVTLYECVAGRLPFEGATTEQLFHQILSKEPVRPRALNPLVPRDLETVILKAMEKEPSARYETARAFAEDLEALLEVRPIRAAPSSAITRGFKWARRNRGWTAAIGVGIASVLLTAGALVRQRGIERALENYRAAERVRQSIAAGREPSAQDKLHLERILPDAAARTAFLRDPASPEVWDQIHRHLEDPLRGEGEVLLLRPRAGITSRSPEFRFRAPEEAGPKEALRLVLVSGKSGERAYPIPDAKTEGGIHRFRLPADEEIEAGAWCRWTVEAGPRSPEAPASTNWAYFQVVDPAERARWLDMEETGNAAMDKLLRASAMNAHGLAEEALAELAEFPAGAPDSIARYRDLLLAEAFALLNDRDGVERQRR